MSIYKRKSKSARKTGKYRYAVIIDLPSTETGARKRKGVGTFRTRDEAETAERNAIQARDGGHAVAPKALTVGAMMALFLEYCRNDRDHHTASTIETYTLKSKRYIEPKLGTILLSRLQPPQVADWKNELRSGGGTNGKPLSLKTVHNIFGLLHAALSLAVGLEYIGRNVCDTRVAKPAKLSTAPRSPAKALRDDEIQRLLYAAESTRWHSFLVLALATGARRGELCGLSWDDYDVDRSRLTIRHSLSQTTGCIELKDTKTHQERVVSLSRWACEALRRQRVMQAEEMLRAEAGTYNDVGAVFATPLGGRVTPMSATKAFGRIARAAGISTSRLHDTRHTTASHLIGAGTDVRTVAGVLGHESANITLKVYAHLLGDTGREATDVLGARMEKIAAGDSA